MQPNQWQASWFAKEVVKLWPEMDNPPDANNYGENYEKLVERIKQMDTIEYKRWVALYYNNKERLKNELTSNT